MPKGVYARTDVHFGALRKAQEAARAANVGRGQSVEHRAKISVSQRATGSKGVTLRRYYREHPEARECISRKLRGRLKPWLSKRLQGAGNPARRPKNLMRLSGPLNPMRTDTGKEAFKKSRAMGGKGRPDSRERMLRENPGIRFSCSKPNKLEAAVQAYLNENFPGEWQYNRGEFVIAGKVPDFVNANGRKAVLEVFGDYWHLGEDPATRARLFQQVGFQCIVVWEREFRARPSILLEKLA